MKRTLRHNPRALAWLALALSSAGVVTLAFTLAPRVFFPWPLEWMEGGSLDHALRLLQGRPIYAAPSSEFIPYLYPPLAYLPMALAIALFGPSLPSARIASLVCTLLALACIGRAGARAARHPLGGAIAAGLFAMGFGYGGAFLDLVRVDACFIAFVAFALERLYARKTTTALAVLALSAFAKQHGLLLFAATAAALVREDPRRHWKPVALGAGALGLAYFGLEHASSGWFGRYTLALPLGHPFGRRMLAHYFVFDVFLSLPVLLAASAFSLVRRRHRLRPVDALLIAALAASALGRAHPGGFDNVLLPGFLVLCIGATPLLTRAIVGRNPRAGLAALAALALQLAILWQAPRVYRPTPESAANLAKLLATLDRCARGGSSVALDYAALTATPFLHTMALSDLRAGSDRALAGEATRALLGRLRSRSAPGAIAVGESFPELDAVLAARYRICARVAAPELASGYSPRAGDTRGIAIFARSTE